MKNTIIAVVVVLVLLLGGFFVWKSMQGGDVVVNNQAVTPTTSAAVVTPPPTAPVVATTTEDKTQTTIGTSVAGRKILAYHFGSGAKEVLFVGGVHGGYEWNTTLVAYQLMDYLKANPSAVPANIRVTVIPTLNPDGLAKVVGTDGRFSASDVSSSNDVVIAGRYNANNVDLNRNFDCDWKATGIWQKTSVSGGANAFSEPESQAFENYVNGNMPSAVVVWFSSAGGVYSSDCGGDILPETAAINKIYADASGYPSYKTFDSYQVTGDMVNWLAKQSVPAISVLLTNHTDTEWAKNLAGINALLAHYAN